MLYPGSVPVLGDGVGGGGGSSGHVTPVIEVSGHLSNLSSHSHNDISIGIANFDKLQADQKDYLLAIRFLKRNGAVIFDDGEQTSKKRKCYTLVSEQAWENWVGICDWSIRKPLETGYVRFPLTNKLFNDARILCWRTTISPADHVAVRVAATGIVRFYEQQATQTVKRDAFTLRCEAVVIDRRPKYDHPGNPYRVLASKPFKIRLYADITLPPIGQHDASIKLVRQPKFII